MDINLDLNTGLYKPYMKDNDSPVYVNTKSNHPPLVLKNIPMGINRRLSMISANKEVFDNSVAPYQEALNKSGYSHKLEFEPATDLGTKKKIRRRNVTWFNPPYSTSVKTNIGRDFLSLLDKAFPPSNPLHKLFNRQTVKISYKCMPNMAQAISRHNVKVLKDDQQQQDQQPQPGCNCSSGPGTCPVQGKCLTPSVVYRATVRETATGNSETYTGLTCNTFKDRWNQHNSDIRNVGNRHKTKLSLHAWDLKDSNTDFKVEWDFIEQASTFNPITKKCRLCLIEKYHIMYNNQGSTLNKRQEVFNTCRHRKQKLLTNVKS